MKVFTVDEPIFKTEPLFVGDCSHEELCRYLHRRFRVDIEAREDILGTVMTFKVKPWRVVWVHDCQELPVLLHELFHLVTAICDDRGIPIVAHHSNGECGDETAAYLYEYFAKACLKRWRRSWR